MRQALSLLALGICINVVAATAAHAENWARFRGPNGTGVSQEQGLPAQWNADEVAWKLKMSGTGHSSPVLWDDKVYVTYTNQDNGASTVLAAYTSNGGVAWATSYEVTPTRQHKLNSYAASTLAADKDGLYGIWGGEELIVFALDHKGEKRWEKNFGPMHLAHGPGASPILYKNLVIITFEQEENNDGLQGRWYALDRNTGALRWQLLRENGESGSSSTPFVMDGQIIFSSNFHGITAVNPADGKVLWEQADALPARAVSSPLLTNGLIVVTSGKGGGGVQLSAVAPPKDGQPARNQYAITEKFVPYCPTPVAKDDLLFLVHDRGAISCLDAETGKLHWQETPGGKFFGSPIIAGDKLYCINTDGQVVVLAASKTYACLGINDLGEDSEATPAVANGKIYFRTNSHLICVAGK